MIIRYSHSRKKNQKSQASVEFLMTYSWAFLVIIIIMGALMYFDVFNPDRYIPDDCAFGTNVVCEDWSIIKVSSSTFNMNLKLKNNLEKAIEPVNMSIFTDNFKLVDNCNFKVSCPYNTNNTNWTAPATGIFVPDSSSWKTGQSCRFEATGCESPVIAGSKNALIVNLAFKRKGGSTDHLIRGKVFSRVINP